MAASEQELLATANEPVFYVVQPHRPPASSVHFLSNIDLSYTKPEFARLLLFYRDCFSPAAGAKSVLDRLKSSLSEVLAAYPILAGRLAEDESSEKLVVNVSGQGVHFVEATVDANLRDWQDLRHCPLEVDLTLEAHITDPCESPLVTFQVTQFRCGGLAVAVHFMHVAVDGYSLVKFLHSWAEVYRSSSSSGTSVAFNSISNSGNHKFLVARDPPLVDAPVPFLIDSSDREWTESNLVPCNLVTLRMERSAIEKCKREVETGAFTYGKVTSFEAVSSLLWSSILRARGILHHLDTSFVFPVNLRSHKGFNVPVNYFGNAAAACQVYAARSGDVVCSDLSYAARLIHKGKISCNGKSVQSMLDWMEMNPGGVDKQLHWKRGIKSTTITNFPFYEIDFGWRGGAVSQLCFLPSTVPPHSNFSAMLPSPRPDAIDVVVGLQDQDRDMLLEDHRFTRYFSLEEIKLWTRDCIRKALKIIPKK